MKRRYITTPWSFLIALSLVALITATAFAFGPGHGRSEGFGGLRMLMNLDLTSEQKAEVKSILDRHQNEQEALHEQMRSARRTFRDIVQAADYDEARVREAFQVMVPVMEDMAVFHTRLRDELKTVLTPEQLENLEARRAELKGNHRQHRQFRRAVLDAWLTSNP